MPQTHPAPSSAQSVIRTIQSWIDKGVEENMKDAWAVMLARGCLRERYPDEEGWPTLSEWRRYLDINVFDNKKKRKISRSHHLGDLLYRRCEGRVFMRTEDGSIGLGRKGARKGEFECPGRVSKTQFGF
jgi:hypothetical protein